MPPDLLAPLDFIPSCAAQLLPSTWRSGIHVYFRMGFYCFPDSFWIETVRYLRTAIPANAIAFFAAVTFVRFVLRLVTSPYPARP